MNFIATPQIDQSKHAVPPEVSATAYKHMVRYIESRTSLRVDNGKSMPLTESQPKSQQDCIETMSEFRMKYSRNIIIEYININSIRNKFNNFVGVVNSKIGIIVIAETKLDLSFANCQFMINGFGQPVRLDVSSVSGGILVYIENEIIAKLLKDLEIPRDIEIVPKDINIWKQKLLLPLNRNASQNQAYFVGNLTSIVDRYSASYERVLITGDFNMEVTDKNLIALIEAYE